MPKNDVGDVARMKVAGRGIFVAVWLVMVALGEYLVPVIEN